MRAHPYRRTRLDCYRINLVTSTSSFLLVNREQGRSRTLKNASFNYCDFMVI